MQAMGALSGRRLAGYELGASLGDDGFGPIYEARHLNLARSFALRILSDQFTFAQDFEKLFWRVSHVLSTLEHTNILTLDDYGIEGPYAYLVTPFVEGMTLEAWLGQRPGKPIPPAQVIRLFGQMLASLDHAHQASVTHLGLAPRHILIQPNGHLLVANFGLPYLAEQLWITWNGRRAFGDPLYLAPEQIPGRTPAGVSADLYALGIILYRLLTSALPFAGLPQAMLEAKLAGPPPLSANYPDLPPPLEAIVRQALAPVPDDRWPSAVALGRTFYHALGQASPLPASALPAASKARSTPLLLGPGGDTSASISASVFNTSAPAPASPEQGSLPPAAHPRTSAPRVLPPGDPPALKSEGSAVMAWSSAGKGRGLQPPPSPPPDWRAEEVQPRKPARPASRAHRLVSATLKLLFLLATSAILSAAIFYGYQHIQMQHQMATPTAAPSPTPTPKHRHRLFIEHTIL